VKLFASTVRRALINSSHRFLYTIRIEWNFTKKYFPGITVHPVPCVARNGVSMIDGHRGGQRTNTVQESRPQINEKLAKPQTIIYRRAAKASGRDYRIQTRCFNKFLSANRVTWSDA